MPHRPDGVVLRGAVVATTKMSEHLAVAGGDKTDARAPIWVFVVSHPVHGTILIDAGYGRRTQADPDDLPGKRSERLLDLEMKTPVVTLLAEQPQIPPVKHILLTHVHSDHAAGVEDFPDSELWVAEADWTWGQKDRLLHGVVASPFAGRRASLPAYDYGPFGPFDAHEDLFDDGTVLLFPAPGHTPGSQMVLVRGESRDFLFVGDVSWTDAGLEAERPKGWLVRGVVEGDWKQNQRSLHLASVIRAFGDVVVIAGHEPHDVDRFPAWPEVW